jgi:hypothetical protein
MVVEVTISMTNSGESPDPILTELISLAEAAALSGLSHGHLALLIRRGDLWGKKIGRDWVTTKQAVLDYLASNPKPGPKPQKTA